MSVSVLINVQLSSTPVDAMLHKKLYIVNINA